MAKTRRPQLSPPITGVTGTRPDASAPGTPIPPQPILQPSRPVYDSEFAPSHRGGHDGRIEEKVQVPLTFANHLAVYGRVIEMSDGSKQAVDFRIRFIQVVDSDQQRLYMQDQMHVVLDPRTAKDLHVNLQEQLRRTGVLPQADYTGQHLALMLEKYMAGQETVTDTLCRILEERAELELKVKRIRKAHRKPRRRARKEAKK